MLKILTTTKALWVSQKCEHNLPSSCPKCSGTSRGGVGLRIVVADVDRVTVVIVGKLKVLVKGVDWYVL